MKRKNKPMKFILIGLLFISTLQAAEERFIKKIRFSKDLTVVVAAGDLEPLSFGSFTVRFYRADDEAVSQNFDVDDFVAGIILERDGVIEKVEMLDLDGGSSKELIISVRCAGSGAYLSGFALTLRNETVQVLAQDPGMRKDANVALELGRIARAKK
jgi:hypothetical protein